MIEFGKNKVMEIMRAAGAVEVVQEARYAHLVGAARMSATAETGVCDKFGRTWDVDNLFVMDGSVMPTQGSANPGLTIQALAARTADYLISQKDAIFRGAPRDLATPPVRSSLCPPGTFRSGIPHLR
jgi:choline dehydrogenase-like flavoprotein